MADTAKRYASVVGALTLPLPAWVAETFDANRVAAYDGYDDMYSNTPGTFQAAMRGEEDSAVYIPSAQTIVEAVNRFLAKEWAWAVNSKGAAADPKNATLEAKRVEVESALGSLFKREELRAKFYSLKRNMLKRGDALWLISLDPVKPEGSRISIQELDARHYFRIPDPADNTHTVGCYIVDLMVADDGTTQIARRQTYMKCDTQDRASAFKVPLGSIFYQMAFFEPGSWDDRFPTSKPLKSAPTPVAFSNDPALLGMALPSSITALPVYHVRNRRSNDTFGVSEIAGVETLIAAINQGASDEDIALALQGLGVYVTTATRPVNEAGEEQEWVIAPGTVIELKSVTDKFDRVPGLEKITASQEHLGYLDNQLTRSRGLSNVAVGKVEVQIAQSGIALRLELSPILAANEEKEEELRSRLDQMLHDMVFMWMPLDGLQTPDPEDISIDNSFGDPLPEDEDKLIDRIIKLVGAGLMSKSFAIETLSKKLGYQFPSDMLDEIVSNEDRVAARMAAELGIDAGGIEAPPASAGGTTPPAPTGAANPVPATVGGQ
jgi:hypothetical protein